MGWGMGTIYVLNIGYRPEKLFKTKKMNFGS